MSGDHPRGSDNLLTSLKIVSRIRQHEKISTTGTIVRIDGQQSATQALRRWWTGENREKNLEDVRQLIDTAFHDLDLLRRTDEEADASSTNRVYVLRLETELRGAMHGLENLQSTYEDDSVAHARIDVLRDRIRTQLGDDERKKLE
jgi:hypothetical protein